MTAECTRSLFVVTKYVPKYFRSKYDRDAKGTRLDSNAKSLVRPPITASYDVAPFASFKLNLKLWSIKHNMATTICFCKTVGVLEVIFTFS